MKKVLMCAVVASMLASCSNNEDISNATASNELGVNVSVLGTPTKGIIAGATFADAATIGLILDDEGGAGYASAVKSYTLSGGSWTASPSFFLSNVEATVYGFFPYPATPATDVDLDLKTLKNVNVLSTMNLISAEQNDYMYATAAKDGEAYPLATANNTEAKKTVTLFFHHALSKLRFKINNADYSGVGKINSLTLESKPDATAGLFQSGTAGVMELGKTIGDIGKIAGLTLTDKITLNGTSATETLDVMPTQAAVATDGFKAGKIKIGAGETAADYAYVEALVAPISLSSITAETDGAATFANAIQLTLTIDGTPKTVWIKKNALIGAWEAGKEYTYTLNVGATGLTITSISIVDWTPVEDGNALEIK